MAEFAKSPKVFISYAWEDDIKLWGRALATRLRAEGVETILDQWEVVPGDQLPEFMETSVRASDFVLVICTPLYKDKSDSSDPSGVGYEKGVITGELFVKRNQRKFIPILRKGKWLEAAPSWVLGKTYIDLRGKSYSEDNYEELLRTIYGKREPPPPLGSPHDFSGKDDRKKKPPVVPKKPLISKDVLAKVLASLERTRTETFTALKTVFSQAMPVLKIAGFAGIVIGLLWAGSWAVPKFISPTPTTKPSAVLRSTVTITFTNSPVPVTETKKPNPTPTKTHIPLLTSTPIVFNPHPDPSDYLDAHRIPMHLVPAGDFTMGSDSGEVEEQPVHIVYLDAFYIDKYEVTNILYKDCVDRGVCAAPKELSSFTHASYYGNSGYNNYPVIYVDWAMAKTYCEWRGALLPTEAQWEKVARGADARTYPWGEDIDCSKANYYDGNKDCVGDTTAVGSYESGKSPYSVYDMAGNVWEWVADWHSKTYYQNSPSSNPPGSDFGTYREVRGGGWDSYSIVIFSFGRAWDIPSNFNYHTGFRCAKDAAP